MRLLCRYIVTVLIGLDILLNALLGGEPYETISARIGQKMENPDHRWSRWHRPAWWRRHCLGAVRS